MTSRRQHEAKGFIVTPLPGGPNPPLTHRNILSVPYGKTIFKMQMTGYHRWGFAIVRTAPYNDANEELWDAMLKRIYADAEKDSANRGIETSSLLKPLLQWEVLQDPEHPLEDSDIDGAKRRFLTWRNAAFVERGQSIARFRFFIMVDQESLDSLKEERTIAESPNPPRILSKVKVRVVDAGRPDEVQGNDDEDDDEDDGCGEDDEDEGDDNDSEGEDDYKWDLGWMWVKVSLLLSFCDVLQTDQGWELFYERPPKMYG